MLFLTSLLLCRKDETNKLKKIKVNRIDETFQLDSFKIRIPMSKCKVLDEGLTGNLIIVNDKTGLVLDRIFKKNAFPINDGGINIYFAIEEQTTSNQTRKSFLTMLLTTKLLKERYFEGITENNIKLVYEAVINYGIVSFTYNTFLNGELTDVDFKKDMSTADMDSIIKGCYSLTKENHKMAEVCRTFNKKDNKGIQWSKRDTTEVMKKPFVKIYHKGLDLTRSKSNEFYKNYILGTPAENEADNRARV